LENFVAEVLQSGYPSCYPIKRGTMMTATNHDDGHKPRRPQLMSMLATR